MLESLANIVEIRFGVNHKAEPKGNIALLQGKDFDDIGYLIKDNIYNTSQDLIKSRDYLQFNEVLLAAKGNRNYAVCWKQEIQQSVASSTFFILTVLSNKILADYLALYLNLKSVQHFLQENASGSNMPNISRKVLDLIEIPIPPLEKQQQLIKLHGLWIQEKLLLNQIATKKELYIQSVIESTIQS